MIPPYLRSRCCALPNPNGTWSLLRVRARTVWLASPQCACGQTHMHVQSPKAHPPPPPKNCICIYITFVTRLQSNEKKYKQPKIKTNQIGRPWEVIDGTTCWNAVLAVSRNKDYILVGTSNVKWGFICVCLRERFGVMCVCVYVCECVQFNCVRACVR